MTDIEANKPTKLYPFVHGNNRNPHEENNFDYQVDPDLEEDYRNNYPKKPRYMHLHQSRKDHNEEGQSYDRNQRAKPKSNNYQRNTEKRVVYYKASEDDSKRNNNNSNNYYFNEFNIVKKSIELEKKYAHRSGYTLKNPTQKNINEKYYKAENEKVNYDNRNTERSIEKIKKKEENNIKDLKYNQKNIQNNYKINNNTNYENENDNYEEEYTPKYYRNNPLVRKGNIQRKKLHMGREENPLKSVAQKICNIVIKGDDSKKNKNLDSNKRNENVAGFIGDEVIDSAVTFKNMRFNSNNKDVVEFENDLSNDPNGNEFENEENENEEFEDNEKEADIEGEVEGDGEGEGEGGEEYEQYEEVENDQNEQEQEMEVGDENENMEEGEEYEEQYEEGEVEEGISNEEEQQQYIEGQYEEDNNQNEQEDENNKENGEFLEDDDNQEIEGEQNDNNIQNNENDMNDEEEYEIDDYKKARPSGLSGEQNEDIENIDNNNNQENEEVNGGEI